MEPMERMGDMRNAYNILFGKSEENSPLWEPKRVHGSI
jgi:hypothetical protein